MNEQSLPYEELKRQLAADALCSSRQLLEATEALSAVGGWEWDVATQVMAWTEGTYRIHDLDPVAVPAGSPEHIERSLACYAPEDRPRIEEAFRRCLEEGEPYDLECDFTSTKGRRMCVRTMGRAIRENGRVVKILGNLQDITERKRAEEEAARSTELLRDVVDMVPAYICAKNREGRFLLVNRKLADFYGLPIDTMTGMLHAELCEDEAELRAMLAADRQVIDSGRAEVIPEETMKKPDGSIAVLETYKIPFTADGKPAVLIAASDITERKRVEEALRESVARFRSYIEHSPYGVFVVDGQGRYIDVNPAAVRITGYSAGQLISMRISELLPQESREAGWRHFQTLVETGESVGDTTFRRADGSVGHWTVSATRLGPDSYLGFVEDITERKDREARMALLVRMLDDVPAAITIHDTNGRFLFSNRQNVLLHGYDSEKEFLSVNLHELDMPESEALLAERFQQITERGEARFEVEHHRKDGSAFPLDVTARAIEWRGQQVVLSIAIDITERRIAEQALRDSEERFRAANDASLDALLLLRSERDETGEVRDFVFVDVNRRTEEMLRMSRDQLLGKRLCEVLPINREAGFFEKYKQVVDTGVPLEEEFFLPETHVPAAWYYHQVVKVHDGIFICHRDIGDRKRTEAERENLHAQLQQSQKMESVGRLAGGVAHDFNNMLGVILGHADMAMEQVDPTQPIHADLQEIRKAAERSSDLTRQLLAFARKQTIFPRILDLNEMVEGMLKMLRRLIGEDIQLSWLPGANLWPVKVDPSQIDQILVNLSVNARDAIAGVGKVTIETGNVAFDDNACIDHAGLIPGEYVLLALSDDGCGMDRETQSHLFEPFFTTKGVGKGTGLGLATVYGIVKQNNGFINVDSEPGQGTTVKVYLPRSAGKAERARAEGSREPVMRGHETVLVVEDEKALLDMSRRMLEKQGYRVLAASTPGEAIRLAEEYPGEIHLLMTDVVMPEMNGRDLAKTMLSLYPHLKCLFMSGYTADVIAHRGVLDDDVHFIQKPFSIKGLVAKVREALG